MMMAVLGAAIIFSAVAEDAPWNFDSPALSVDKPSAGRLDADILNYLVQLYRDNEAKTSVHRCIFNVTCSHFAQLAVEKHGLALGGIMFIDRYFYRENIDARLFYPLESEQDGTFRFNDNPFVP